MNKVAELNEVMTYKLWDIYEIWYKNNEKEIEMNIWGETGLLPESEKFQDKARDMFLMELSEMIWYDFR